MTYKESYLQCNNLEDLIKEVNDDLLYAMLMNTDRIEFVVKNS
jgi:hypothetical protein